MESDYSYCSNCLSHRRRKQARIELILYFHWGKLDFFVAVLVEIWSRYVVDSRCHVAGHHCFYKLQLSLMVSKLGSVTGWKSCSCWKIIINLKLVSDHHCFTISATVFKILTVTADSQTVRAAKKFCQRLCLIGYFRLVSEIFGMHYFACIKYYYHLNRYAFARLTWYWRISTDFFAFKYVS